MLPSAAEEAGAGEVLKADEVVPLESVAVKRSAANFNAEEIPMATSIFKGMDYARTKGPPESLRVSYPSNMCIWQEILNSIPSPARSEPQVKPFTVMFLLDAPVCNGYTYLHDLQNQRRL